MRERTFPTGHPIRMVRSMANDGGQQTNCRINALANRVLAAGRRIEILYRVTRHEDARPAERAWMREHGLPAWNARDER